MTLDIGKCSISVSNDGVSPPQIAFTDPVSPDKWRPPSLSELSAIISNMELTHLGLETSICIFTVKN